MPIVMIQRGCANGLALRGDGQYLKSFDCDADDGRGEIELTPNLAAALVFKCINDAIRFRNMQSSVRPMRDDGWPNRPLTAANWQFEFCPE